MKNSYYALLAAAALSFASCSSVDLDPTNQYDVAYAMSSEANANLYVNYFYQVIAQWGQFGSCALGGANSNMSDGLTDILKYGGIVGGTGDCNLIMTVSGQQSVSRNYFDSWTSGYSWIRRFNEALKYLDMYKSKFSESQYSRIKAEILFFRAHVEFMMMRCHASAKDGLGIILYDTLDQMSIDTKDTPRASLEQSWDAIERDARYAMEHLPEPATAAGRVHRYAAAALMARAMLYAERYDKALEAVQVVEASTLYGYIDDYASIFKTLDNSEVIWGFGYASGTLTHSFDLNYSMPGDYCLSGSKGGGWAGPTQEFVDAFDRADGSPYVPDADRFITNENVGARDPRLAACVLYNGAIWKDRALECFEGGVDQKYMPYGSVNSPGNTVTGYYMRKLLDETNTDFQLNGSYQPWPEYRYAELQLIKAECLAKAQDWDGARSTLSALRKARFGREDVITAPISDWESALDAILHERMIELCYEGHRFWDLRRTGRARATLDGKKYTGVLWKPSGAGFTAESVSADMGARRYPDNFDRFPLPQTEISNNTQAKQNADW